MHNFRELTYLFVIGFDQTNITFIIFGVNITIHKLRQKTLFSSPSSSSSSPHPHPGHVATHLTHPGH